VKAIDRACTALSHERGQTMSEYTIVLSVITLGILTAMGLLSGAIGAAIDEVVSLIP
jgi:Flp pilus assembly pilin Flp